MSLFLLVCIVITFVLTAADYIYFAKIVADLEKNNDINERNLEQSLDNILKLQRSIQELNTDLHEQGRNIYEQSKVICSLRKQIKKLKRKDK